MDGRPRARAAHADAVHAVDLVGDARRGFEHLRQIGRRRKAEPVEHRLIVGDRVQLEAPGDAPLLRALAAELLARHPRPGGRGAQIGQHVLPIIVRVGQLGVVDERVQVHQPAGGTILPGLIRTGHEGVIFGGTRAERCGHLVEIDVLGKDVIDDVHTGHLLEIVEIGDHGVGIGMLVQQQFDGGAGVFFPVEVRRQRPARRAVQHKGKGTGADAEGGGTLKKLAAAHASLAEGLDGVVQSP